VQKIILIFIGVLMMNMVIAQKITTTQYIERYKDFAIKEMIRSGVPAAITLAQGVLETESGNSVLVKKSNNHFGIKCKVEWIGEKVYHDDDESGECFRKYDSAYLSYIDHSDFLRNRAHYAFLFSLDPSDYSAWAHGLKKAGYATNPRYPQILIKTIEDYNLNEFTTETLKEIPDYSIYAIKKEKQNSSIVNQSVEKIGNFIFPSHIKPKAYNGLNAIYVDSGISLLAIATKFGIDLADLLDYNDLYEDGIIEKSSWVYLQRKRIEALAKTYKVKKGETVYDISQNAGIQISYLMAFNGLNEADDLRPGRILSLKSEVIVDDEVNLGSPKSTSSKNKSTVKYHEVKPNENLQFISKKYNVDVEDLKEWNNLNSMKLKIGQRLIVSK
jgi:LysM repeat protein